MSELKSLAEGRYLLVETLGQGGMATVYRAFDQRLQVWRALKVLAEEYSSKRKLMARFEAEAQMMAQLEHPNIVRVYDVGRDGDRAYIVMELIEGGSLVDWLERHGPMPSRMAVDVMVDVCQAITAAHAKGIIHRDIKPHNVMVTSGGVCRVTDFGIARIGDTGEALTRTGAVMGTWGYMAPEQRADAKNVDVRADIYSLAATLYSLLTDRTPMDLFAADRDPSMMAGVDPHLAEILIKATDYHRDHRYRSVDELMAAMLAVREDLPPDPEGVAPLPREIRASPPIPRPSPEGNTAGATILPSEEPVSGVARGGSETILPTGDHGSAVTRLPSEGERLAAVGSQDRPIFIPGPETGPGTAHTGAGTTPTGVGAGGSRPGRWIKLVGAALWVMAVLLLGATWMVMHRADQDAPIPLGNTPAEVKGTVEPVAPSEPPGTPAQKPAETPPPKPVESAPPKPAETPAETPPKPVEASAPKPVEAPAPKPVEASAPKPGTAEPTPGPGDTTPAEPGTTPQLPGSNQCVHVTPPSGVLRPGQRVTFIAELCVDDGTSVSLYYRPSDSPTWSSLLMPYLLGARRVQITLDDSFATGLDWYVVAGKASEGSRSNPRHITIGN